MTGTTGIDNRQDSSVGVELPAYFIAFQIKDFYLKSYTQELIEDYPYNFDRAVTRWNQFIERHRNGKLSVSCITPADLFEFSTKTSQADMAAIACLCFLHDYVAKEGFLIE
jgi:hypothetical protein